MPDLPQTSPAGGIADSTGGPREGLPILLLEAHAPEADRIERELARNTFHCKLRRVMSRDAFRKELQEFSPALVIADYSTPGMTAREAILLVREIAPAVPLIIVTSGVGDEAAAECIKAGADDLILRERLNRLVPAIGTALARRRAAQEAEERVRHYRALLDAIPEGVVELDREERIRYANRQFCDMLGYSAEELAGRRGLDVLVNGEMRETSLLRKAGAPDRFEIPVHRKSGELLWLELSGTPITDEHGAPCGSLGIVRDVTARKAQEEDLREREETFAAAFHASPVPMTISTFDAGLLADANDSFLAVVGLRREDVIGRRPDELGLMFFQGDRKPLVERLVREGSIPAIEMEVRLPSAGVRFWRISLHLIRTGSRAAALSVVDDVTDEKRAREALRESEKRFEMFSESAFEGILVADGGKIIDTNEQLAQMLGWDLGGLAGRDVLDIVAPASRDAVAEAVRTGAQRAYEVELLRKDGSMFPAEARGRSFLHRGRPVRVTAIRDITRHRRHEALLNGQRQVLELIVKGTPLNETLDTLLRVIEAQSADMLCSILLLDRDGTRLRHAAAPRLPEEYVRAIDGSPIGEGAGSCGTAAFRGEQVIVEDIASDPLWEEYRSLALPHGLRACWSTPIFDPQRRVLGTFAMYFTSPRRPAEEQQRLVEMATHTAAIAILKHAREEALRISEEKFSRAFQQSPDSITISRMEDGRFTEANEGFERISGYRREEAIGRTALELGIWQNAEQRGQLVDGLRRHGAVRNMDFELTIKGGAVRACQISAERITLNGEDCLLATTRDVTEQKRADEELRRRSQEIEELLARVTDGFVALNKNWEYIYVNRNAAAMFGRDQESLMGKHIWTEFPEGVGQPFHLAYERAMRTQQAESIEEYYAPWKKWYENRIYPSPDGLSIYFRDITESKRAEVLLRESQQRYQTLIESVEGIVWEAEAATLRVTFVSHQAERLLRYPVARWLEERSFWLDHVHAEDRPRVAEHRRRQQGGLGPHDVEYRMITADGRTVWLRDIAGVVTEDGSPTSLRGLMIDITEQKAASEALKRSEAKFRAVAETAAAAIFVYRGDDIAYVNAGAAAITGYTVAELAAAKFSDIIHPDSRDLVRGRGDLRILGEEEPARYELRLVTKSGEDRWVDFSAGLMEFDGKKAALGMAFDITDRKLAEEQLQHTTEQLRALSAHLLSVREEEQMRISREIHDQLGQAMTGLRMDASWITKRLGDGREDLKTRVDGMMKLIDETIGIVRRISSELRPGVLDTLGLVPAIDWLAKEFQTRTGIACQVQLPDEPPVLNVEISTAVFRILQETLTNVARHAEASTVTIVLTMEGDTLVLTVADNGRGIRAGEIGKSLGLVGMRERAINAGGSVSVTGEEGTGTKVFLRIPLHRPAP